MQVISPSDAAAQMPAILAKVQQEPVLIRDAEKDVAVVLSASAYARYKGAKTKDLQALCERASAYAKTQGLTEEKLAQLLTEEE